MLLLLIAIPMTTVQHKKHKKKYFRMHALPAAGRYYHHSISTYDVHTCVVFVEFQRKEREEKKGHQNNNIINNKTIKQK